MEKLQNFESSPELKPPSGVIQLSKRRLPPQPQLLRNSNNPISASIEPLDGSAFFDDYPSGDLLLGDYSSFFPFEELEGFLSPGVMQISPSPLSGSNGPFSPDFSSGSSLLPVSKNSIASPPPSSTSSFSGALLKEEEKERIRPLSAGGLLPPNFIKVPIQRKSVPVLRQDLSAFKKKNNSVHTVPPLSDANMLSREKRKHRKPAPLVISEDRTWEVLRKSNALSDVKLEIEMKSRLEERVRLVPDRLYSTIQYQFFLQLESSFFLNESFRFLLSRVCVWESDASSSSSIAGGLEGPITECALSLSKKKNRPSPPSSSSSTNRGLLKGKLMAKFNKKLSSHNTQKEYRYRIVCFLPSNLEKPVLEIQSPPFKVYSRKPNRRKKKSSLSSLASSSSSSSCVSGRKRKRSSIEESVNKRRKGNDGGCLVVCEKESEYKEFREKFENLMEFQKGIQNEEEKGKCKDMLVSWLKNEFQLI